VSVARLPLYEVWRRPNAPGTTLICASGVGSRGHRSSFVQGRGPDCPTRIQAGRAKILDASNEPVRSSETKANVLDVAGSVMDGRAMITNLPWVVMESSLKEALRGDAVRLLNDLEATAIAAPILESAELRTLSAGHPTMNKATRTIPSPTSSSAQVNAPSAL
jgi:glucokinase